MMCFILIILTITCRIGLRASAFIISKIKYKESMYLTIIDNETSKDKFDVMYLYFISAAMPIGIFAMATQVNITRWIYVIIALKRGTVTQI